MKRPGERRKGRRLAPGASVRLALVLLLAGAGGCPPKVLGGASEPVPLGQEVVDPVSGARCVRDPSTESAVYMDRNHYFCAAGNRLIFIGDPERYAYHR